MNAISNLNSPTRIKSKVESELSPFKKAGSKDDVMDDLYDIARSSYSLRLAVYHLIDLDNLMHQIVAGEVAAGRNPKVTPGAWNTFIGKAMQFVIAKLQRRARLWKTKSLNRMEKVFRIDLQQLTRAITDGEEFIDDLRD